jgi:integrase
MELQNPFETLLAETLAARDRSPRTQETYVWMVRLFGRFLERPVDQRVLPEILAPEEVAAVLDACTNLKHRALLMTSYSGGLRFSETLGLVPGHLARQIRRQSSPQVRVWRRSHRPTHAARLPIAPSPHAPRCNPKYIGPAARPRFNSALPESPTRLSVDFYSDGDSGRTAVCWAARPSSEEKDGSHSAEDRV